MIGIEKARLNLKRLMCYHFGHNWYREENGAHGPVYGCGCGLMKFVKGWAETEK